MRMTRTLLLLLALAGGAFMLLLALAGGAFMLLLALAGGASSYSDKVIDINAFDLQSAWFVNLTRVKNTGIVAIIHEATSGLSRKDDYYSNMSAEAQENGLLWGAYHSGTEGSGADQAMFFLQTVNSTNDALRRSLLALSIGPWSMSSGMTKEQADEFVRTVHRETGRYPLLKGTPYFLEFYNTTALKNCQLWLKDIDLPNDSTGPDVPSGWSTWTLWQYARGDSGGDPKGNLDGIGRVKRNRYRGTTEELRVRWPLH